MKKSSSGNAVEKSTARVAVTSCMHFSRHNTDSGFQNSMACFTSSLGCCSPYQYQISYSRSEAGFAKINVYSFQESTDTTENHRALAELPFPCQISIVGSWILLDLWESDSANKLLGTLFYSSYRSRPLYLTCSVWVRKSHDIPHLNFRREIYPVYNNIKISNMILNMTIALGALG